MRDGNDWFVRAAVDSASARDANRELLSELRRVEQKTRLRQAVQSSDFSITFLSFGLFMRRERVHFPFGSRYGAEFLYCLGSAGT